jgi:hypothetical protein
MSRLMQEDSYRREVERKCKLLSRRIIVVPRICIQAVTKRGEQNADISGGSVREQMVEDYISRHQKEIWVVVRHRNP